MSMRSWSEEGFGFPLFNGKNERKVYHFLCDHGLFDGDQEEFLEAIEDPDGDMNDVFWEFIGEPASWRIGSEISRLEGLTVVRGYNSCSDTDQEEMIGIEPAYPWEMNEKDLALTKEKAVSILKKYALVLGIDAEPDYFDAEYYG